MIQRFTGWHMTAILLAFFGVVVSVNLLMATFATRTFGGTVVDNSYVASQKYNDWLREAREQSRLQWQVRMAPDEEGGLLVRAAAPEGPLDEAMLAADLSHPLGREPGKALTFVPLGNGTYRSQQKLPSGRWIVRLTIARAGVEARFLEELGR
ncbi:MAG TPA: FixH family protein [Allosphingosinicella sp.]|nr:FixH family protein [Allosphingosinicella sp.]